MQIESVLKTQNFLLSVAPGLLPLATLTYSALNSWHCSLMCGGYAVGLNERQMHRLLAVRLFAYTAMGGLIGFGGQLLVKALEFQVLRVFAFGIFIGITFFCIIPNLIPGLARFSFLYQWPKSFRNKFGPTFTGMLFAVTPCHLLSFYYGLAATTGSAAMGGALLFGHVVMTSPALAYVPKFTNHVAQSAPWVRVSLRILILGIVILQAFYFLGRLLNPSEDIQNRILFCF